MSRPIIVVAGVGNGSGTGGATARVFSKAGYRVALISRAGSGLQKTTNEIKQAGGEAVAFPIESYSYQSLTNVFDTIRTHSWKDTSGTAPEIRAALWNGGVGVWKRFFEVTERDLQLTAETNVHGAFAFARQVILAFRQNEVDELGKRGTLLFTGATASLRGNVPTSAFSAGKFALRALSQSLNKEFGPENIHVAHAIIDGNILTDESLTFVDETSKEIFKGNANLRLDPESIGKSYLYLAKQDRSAWTWELDLRPAHEKW
ncbi:short-chain dehydrogenase/reductase SDR [Trametes versicolor FP-101664 SS1]|uniref:short-chain dehydrogenase/reductase SDR n=1 Tax=Trametes versicolor (strain FP-101664) TaxID=717944 RepID=UPI000462165E|nr:short-chain dehydrogenase/reductase SDR [Trametes versicolor FP-101664 SS1]EIW52596.1 short-chain dehydrogenase/reductase SDR [Trametes versicolor FP-101664 SS1]